MIDRGEPSRATELMDSERVDLATGAATPWAPSPNAVSNSFSVGTNGVL